MDTINNHIVDIRQLCFSRQQKPVFKQLDLTVPRGKIIAIMGPSGCGKTTLLKLIGGQLQPERGQVKVFGEDIQQLSSPRLYQLRQRMGLLFQNGALFTNLSVFENVAFPLREHTKLSNEMIACIVLMKLQAVGLRGAAQLMPSQLSGGMARRVALARTIALDPELIMYDEPFAGQDPIGKGILVSLIKRINQAFGLTTILVSHDVPETLQIADYVYLLAPGKLLGEGTPEDIRNSDDPQVKQFINGLADGSVPFHYPAPDYQQALLAEVNHD